MNITHGMRIAGYGCALLLADSRRYGLSAPCGEKRHGVFCGEVVPVPFADVTVQQPAQLVSGRSWQKNLLLLGNACKRMHFASAKGSSVTTTD